MEDLATVDNKIDNVQLELSRLEQVECPLQHIFLPGLYIRQIFMPAYTVNSANEVVQTVIVSKIHKTFHSFNVSKGSCAVYNKADDFAGMIIAPYHGTTIPGTRRILVITEDCFWATNHILPYISGEENWWSEEDKIKLLERIEKDLIEEHEIMNKEVSVCHS